MDGVQLERVFWEAKIERLTAEIDELHVQLTDAYALSAAVDAYLLADNNTKARDWRQLLDDLVAANEVFKEAGG